MEPRRDVTGLPGTEERWSGTAKDAGDIKVVFSSSSSPLSSSCCSVAEVGTFALDIDSFRGV